MARVLVAYATKHHSTEEIAEAITSELRNQGHRAECIDADHATADGYDAVVLGSAVYMGQWRREAKRFLKHERPRLSAMPFWIFSSGPVGADAEEGREKDLAWLEPRSVLALAEELGARDHVVFGGRMPTEARGFIESAMARSTPPEMLDNRDWDQIRNWTTRVAGELTSDKGDA